jgi:hypothetical protein
MNIFIFDLDHKTNARYHCDRHNNKMILESAQVLCSALHINGLSFDWMYKPTHLKHGCVLWAAESWENWSYLTGLLLALRDEKIFRTGKDHKSGILIANIPPFDIEQIYTTLSHKPRSNFYLAMPDKYQVSCPVTSYRNYFMGEKQHLAQWSQRPIPHWYTPEKLDAKLRLQVQEV